LPVWLAYWLAWSLQPGSGPAGAACDPVCSRSGNVYITAMADASLRRGILAYIATESICGPPCPRPAESRLAT